jgi:hypothetical protein
MDIGTWRSAIAGSCPKAERQLLAGKTNQKATAALVFRTNLYPPMWLQTASPSGGTA